jgi:hypothetical protein
MAEPGLVTRTASKYNEPLGLYESLESIEITLSSTSVAPPGITTTNGKGAKSASPKKMAMNALTAIGKEE